MSLPGFKSSVQLTQDPPRLTDKMSGRTLTLSQGEAKLLGHYDGHRTHDELARLAQADGFPLEPMHVAGLLERVAHAGFMDGPPPQLGPTVPELELPTDRVPALRPDLKILRSEKSAGMMEVTDPVRGQTFSLYDFEVSIARMLNGKRTAFQVIEAASKIGIPVTLESLRKFIRQLRAYHFIVEELPPGPMNREGGTWSPRAQWTPEVRELYQSALRRFRAGKLTEANGYIVALLEIDPSNKEAIDLRTRVEQRMKEAPEPNDFTFDELHGGADAAGDFVEMDEPQPAPPPAASPAPSPAIGTPLELTRPPPKKDWRPTTLEFASPTAADGAPKEPVQLHAGPAPDAPAPKWEPTVTVPESGARDVIPNGAFTGPTPEHGTPPAPVPDAPAAPVQLAEAPAPQPLPRKRSIVPWLLLAAVALVGGAAAFPVKSTARVQVKLEPIVLGEVKVERPAKIEQLLVVDGAKVDSGEMLISLDTKSAQASLSSAGDREAQLNLQLQAIDRSVSPKARKKAEAQIAKLQKALEAIAAQKAKFVQMRETVSAMDPKKPGVKKGLLAIDKKLKLNEKTDAKVQGMLASAQAGTAKLLRTQEKQPILDQLELVKAEQQKAHEQLNHSTLKAPIAGIWHPGKKGPGMELAKDEVAGQLAEANKLKIVGALPKDAEPNAIVECGGQRTPVTLSEGIAKTSTPVSPGSCALELRRAPRPLVLTLLGR